MIWFGLVSTLVDVITFVVLFYVFVPQQMGIKSYYILTTDASRKQFMELFWTGWLVTSMWTQTIVIHFLRTEKIPFIQSHASSPIFITTILGIAAITAAQYIPGISKGLELQPLAPMFYAWLLMFVGIYITLIMIVKMIYKKIYKQFL